MASGGVACFERLDVTNEQNWIAVVDKTVKSLGGLDVVVNNAGISFTRLTHEVTLQEWQNLMNINSTTHAPPLLILRAQVMHAQRLADDTRDCPARVERCVRVLEDDLQP